jgi:lupus La protein
MWSLHTANDEHWVPIATIASFKRMREFQLRGIEWVADVLGTSPDLEVSEDRTSVRRRTEVQEPKGVFERSVYAVTSSTSMRTTTNTQSC